MPSRHLPYFGYRLKPHDRLLKVVVMDRPTYVRGYAIVDIGDGEFDLLYQSAGTVTDTDSDPAEVYESASVEGVEQRIAIYERRGMDGPRLAAYRREWDTEAEAVDGLRDLQERWPEVLDWWDEDPPPDYGSAADEVAFTVAADEGDDVDLDDIRNPFLA